MVRWPRSAQSLRAGAISLEGGMVFGGEKKGEVVLAQGAGRLLRLKINLDAQRLQHVGAAGLGGDGAVAVLGDSHAGGGDDERDGGGDVEGVETVAAGAANIQNLAGAGLRRRAGGWMERARNSRAKAAISAAVSPLRARAVRNSALIWGGMFWLVSGAPRRQSRCRSAIGRQPVVGSGFPARVQCRNF